MLGSSVRCSAVEADRRIREACVRARSMPNRSQRHRAGRWRICAPELRSAVLFGIPSPKLVARSRNIFINGSAFDCCSHDFLVHSCSTSRKQRVAFIAWFNTTVIKQFVARCRRLRLVVTVQRSRRGFMACCLDVPAAKRSTSHSEVFVRARHRCEAPAAPAGASTHSTNSSAPHNQQRDTDSLLNT